MKPDSRVLGALGALKVFPLPSAVLFPGTALPLHVFEPRYRDLVRDCLAQDQVMALVDLRPGWEQDYAGRPPLAEVGCAGRVVWHEALPDGRYDVVLHGLLRFRVVQELPVAHAYREVRAEPLPDAPYEGPLEEMVRQAVLEIAGRVTEGVAENLVQMAARSAGGTLADVVASALVPDVEKRKRLLCELDPAKRLQSVLDEMGELIARIGAVSARGPLN